MPHTNSVFHAMTQLIDWNAFDAAVEQHGKVKPRGFTNKSHLLTLLYAQFTNAHSLRHIEAGLNSHAAHPYHLGAGPASRSTLADANRNRPAAVFSDLLGAMIGRAHRGLRRAMEGATYLIDSTSSMLTARSSTWARFSDQTCGVKTHVIHDADADCPIPAAVSTADVNDITAAHAMPVVPGATYVFDLGYHEHAWWAKLDAAKCRIVTRLKCSTKLKITDTRPVAPGGPILSDQTGTLPARMAAARRNPMQAMVREVQVRLDTGRVLRICTNDLDAPAQEIAGLPKRRWAIELFFRWVKQTLGITRFLGTSENAIRIQIAVALIAFVLLRMAQKLQSAVASPLAFARLISANLMHPRRIDQLDRPPQQAVTVAGQGVLGLQ